MRPSVQTVTLDTRCLWDCYASDCHNVMWQQGWTFRSSRREGHKLIFEYVPRDGSQSG